MGPDNIQFGLMVFFTILTAIIPISRWYIMRRQSETMTDKISSGLFYFCSMLAFGITITLAYKSHEGIKLAEKLQEPELTYALLGTRFIKMFFILGIIYLTSLWTIKGAFLAFYWRLFARGQSRLLWILYAAVGIWASASVGCFFYFVFWCFPIENNWSPDPVIFSSCSVLPSLTHNTVTVFLNIFTDVIVLLVPLFIISSLQLPRREKLGLVGVFAVGSVSIISSATRYSVIHKFITNPPLTPAGLRTQELWSVIELLSAMLAYTLPAFRVLIKRRAKAKTERGTTGLSGSHISANTSKNQTTTSNKGAIYVRHDIDVKSLNESTATDEEQGVELGNVRRDNSNDGLVFPSSRR